ncbi:hypothetical protein [Streptomyces luteocolor]|uniref:hypothetical protein n=1 Tax=Streptomyces luteocolor TaxID=285500 RepID=UPI001EDBB637|nr:hypothetical protein [Streptomyces luteocolor]
MLFAVLGFVVLGLGASAAASYFMDKMDAGGTWGWVWWVLWIVAAGVAFLIFASFQRGAQQVR